MPKIKKSSFVIILIDILLVLLAFFSMYYIKRTSLALSAPYAKLLFSFYVLSLVISFYTRKFFLDSYKDYLNGILLIIRTDIFILYGLSIMVVMLGLPAFSRLHVFGSCALLTVFETAVFSLYYLAGGRERVRKSYDVSREKPHFKNVSIQHLLIDFTLLTFSFFLLNYYKRGSLALNPEYEKLLLLMYGLWLGTGFFTRKFEKKRHRNIFYALAPYIRAVFFMVAIMAVLVFALRMFYFSRLQVFGTFLLLLFFEGIYKYFYLLYKSFDKKEKDIETISEVQKIMQQEMLDIKPKKGKTRDKRLIQPVSERLHRQYLKSQPRLFEFINKNIDLNQVDYLESLVLDTHTPYNIENIDNNSLDLFINLHKVNDFRYLNRYFLEVHKKFFNGGYFVSRAVTITTHKKYFMKKYPRFLGEIFYVFNFIYARVLPKLPGFKKVYFTFTKGRNRLISKAELLGRLYFCGFKVLDLKEIDGSLYFVAQKVRTPSFETNPSYGPLIKLQRVGYSGESIYVRKLRTMHPYSEFLQEYIFENHKLQDNGKFNDDFRLTQWGKLFRKFFIDELPQVYNYLRGDVNLVGVRALSQQYFDLYPPDLQKLRIQFKPGMVPPYYADLPKSLEEIIASERLYLQQKEQRPFTTDVKYFSKAMYNIVVKKARSR
jgi:lipopolysaccharide/colanic/teichoic acid biosynthesis glycosyltransferase/Ca2+/Na+ antiporter